LPSSPSYVRDYSQETKTAKKRGELVDNKYRKRARRKAIRLGIINQGDSRDIHHKNYRPKDNSRRNLKATSVSKNRSFARNSKGGVKR